MPRLENWTIITYQESDHLYGEVHEDDRFPEGHHIVTSEIRMLDEENNKAVTRSGTEYTLGKKFDKMKNLN